ncbi:MAG TPA: glycosyltransferase family 4 protein [Acidimicrobiales bacterium]
MKLLFCVQRYGDGVAGGSESACRAVAERLAARGHTVEVVTSRARSYVDWADEFPEGESTVSGVRVHRLSVRAPRSPERFGPIHSRIIRQPRAPLYVQRDWLRLQGPDLPQLEPWLHDNARRFDAAIFFTYLYPNAGFGLPVAARYCPTVLVPTAHDEPTFQLRVFDHAMRTADGIVCLTPEELALVQRRFRFTPNAEVIGLGVDLHQHGEGNRFRAAYGLGGSFLLLYVGRLDPGKGSDELYRCFAEYARRHPGVKLVVVGEPVAPLPPHPDVVVTGFVDEQTKLDAIAAANVFVQPSYFESFSLALCEAWVMRRAAMVQGRCAVLAGQARRSGGALAYRSFAEFAETLHRLRADDVLREQLGEAGRRYVVANYDWDAVITRYEDFVTRIAESWSSPRPQYTRR